MLETLPVVFTLITKQEVGDALREEVEAGLMTVGGMLSVTIDVIEVERFGESLAEKNNCQLDVIYTHIFWFFFFFCKMAVRQLRQLFHHSLATVTSISSSTGPRLTLAAGLMSTVLVVM